MGNTSKDFSNYYMEQIELNGYDYDFSIYFGTTDVDNFLDIHKYLMKNHNKKQCLNFF